MSAFGRPIHSLNIYDPQTNSQFSIDLLLVLLHLLNSANEVNHIVLIVKYIAILAPLAFKEKLDVWLYSLLLKRI